MKKIYSKPVAEKIVFDYRNQVVASGSSGDGCHWKTNKYWTYADKGCETTLVNGGSEKVPG